MGYRFEEKLPEGRKYNVATINSPGKYSESVLARIVVTIENARSSIGG
jgi:hypothetical protein